MPTNEQIIVSTADMYGIPAWIPLDIARVESGLNTYSLGDNGTSFGLFQLHRGGLAGNYSESQLYDPAFNTNVAVQNMVPAYRKGVAAGLTGEDLLQYTAFNSAWPGGQGVAYYQRNRPDYVSALHSAFIGQSGASGGGGPGEASFAYSPGGVTRVDLQDYYASQASSPAGAFRALGDLEHIDSYQFWKSHNSVTETINPLNYFMSQGQKMGFRLIIVLIALAIIIIALLRLLPPAPAAEEGAPIV